MSVVLTFYNEEQFLGEAIESVISQNYSNWELWLVDDGSSRSTTNIAKGYEGSYPGKIHYLEHENHHNRGVCTSRNHGINHCQGVLITFLDADDIWLPAKLSQQIALFDAYPGIYMVAEPSLYWYSWNNPALNDELVMLGPQPDRVYAPPLLLFNIYPLSEGAAPCPSGLMVRKEIFDIAGQFESSFTGDLQLYEDQAFLAKVYLSCPVYISSVCNNWYRQRPDSAVYRVKRRGKYNEARRHFLEWFLEYASHGGRADSEVLKLIKENLFPYRYPVLAELKRRLLRFIQGDRRRPGD